MTTFSDFYPRLSSEEQTRRLVLLAFNDPIPEECARLRNLSRAQWRRLLHWLDTSGLALYLLGRLFDSEHLNWLPEHVLARLEQNLADNRQRTEAMFAESVHIQQQFKQAGVSYAVLKGFSLWPTAVRAPELRSQLDLDFLVAESHVLKARQIVESIGYELHVGRDDGEHQTPLQAVSGRSWTFKTPHPRPLSIKDLYKRHSGRCVELHVEARSPDGSALLNSIETRTIKAYPMPVLSPIDLFLGVALHFYKHVCSAAFRCAHMVEFRNLALSHRDDAAFWNHVRVRAENNKRQRLALGLVTLLATRAIGEFAPDALTNWTVDRLPPAIRLWVETHGLRCALANFPGNKLYLLLQCELEAEEVLPRSSLQRLLLPSRLPPRLVCKSPDAPLILRIQQFWKELRHIFSRLRFHVVEGLRYAWAAHRWQRLVHQISK